MGSEMCIRDRFFIEINGHPEALKLPAPGDGDLGPFDPRGRFLPESARRFVRVLGVVEPPSSVEGQETGRPLSIVLESQCLRFIRKERRPRRQSVDSDCRGGLPLRTIQVVIGASRKEEEQCGQPENTPQVSIQNGNHERENKRKLEAMKQENRRERAAKSLPASRPPIDLPPLPCFRSSRSRPTVGRRWRRH